MNQKPSSHDRYRSRVRATPIALALVLFLSPVPTQGRQAPGGRVPSFGTDVAVVTLSVFVTDKDGAAVPGLRMEDFEVADDGKPATVVGFYEVDATTPPSETMSRAAASEARRQFLLLFDLSFSPAQGIVRARKAALEFLEKTLAPTDLVAVGTVSTKSGFKLLVGFTPDRAQAARAVESLGVTHGQPTPDPLGLAFELGAPAGPAAGGGGDERMAEELRVQVLLLQRSEQVQYNQRVTGFLKSLQQLAQILDSLHGRKQVILLSGGFDQAALVGAQGDDAVKNAQAVTEGRIWEVQSDSHFGDAVSRQGMEDMVRAMAASDTVVHTVDLTGLAAGPDARDAGQSVSPGAGRESLTQMAHLSGGRLVKDTNDIAGALGEVLAASRRYYVLAFEPSSRAPGKFHKLRVKVKGKGGQVSHRAGYVPVAPVPTALVAATRRLEAAEAIAKGVSGGAIDVRVIAVPYRDANRRTTVPVILEVDGRTLLDRGPGNELKLDVYAYAFDGQGSIQDVTAFSPVFDLQKVGEKLRERGLLLQTAFVVPVGTHDLRFLVRDAGTGRTGMRRVPVSLPSFEPGQVVLLPPLFMDDPTAWLSLKVPSRKNAEPEMPFRVEGELFVPRGRPRLVNGTPSRVCVMAFSGSLDPKATFEIRSQLLDAAGKTVRLGAVALAKAVMETDGFRRYVLNVTPEHVAPGEYTFRVLLKDPASGTVLEADQAVRVE